MPHIIIEYAQELASSRKIPSLVKHLHQAAIESGLFDTPAIKSRALAYEDYICGEHVAPFIHVTAKILDGRTLEQQQHLSESLLACLVEHNADVSNLSVDVVEMVRSTYRKT